MNRISPPERQISMNCGHDAPGIRLSERGLLPERQPEESAVTSDRNQELPR